MKTTRDGQNDPVMTLSISGLEERDYPFRFEVPVSALNLEEFYEGTVAVEGTLSKIGSQFRVKGETSATLAGECDRCLAEVRRPTAVDFFLYVEIADDESRGDMIESLEGTDRVLVLGSDENDIVLDREVRQTLRLAVPMKLLCADECKGLCPECGTNLNEGECGCNRERMDPRWAALEQLLPGREHRN